MSDQQDYPVDTTLDGGDVMNRIPANAVGLHDQCTPDSTGLNSEDDVECPPDSPVIPVSEVQLIRPAADRMSVSNSEAMSLLSV